jgi:hypothetical protein
MSISRIEGCSTFHPGHKKAAFPAWERRLRKRGRTYFFFVSQVAQVAHSALALVASQEEQSFLDLQQLAQEAMVRATAARARVRKRFMVLGKRKERLGNEGDSRTGAWVVKPRPLDNYL